MREGYHNGHHFGREETGETRIRRRITITAARIITRSASRNCAIHQGRTCHDVRP
jgi:hypothetical protein